MNLLEVNSICKTYGEGETAVHAPRGGWTRLKLWWETTVTQSVSSVMRKRFL